MEIISFWISCELYLSTFLSNHFKRRGRSFPLRFSNWIKFDSSSVSPCMASSLPGKMLQTFYNFDETYTVRLQCLFCCIVRHFQCISTSSGKVYLVVNGYFVPFRYLMLLEASQSFFPFERPLEIKLISLLLAARRFDFAFCCTQMKQNTESFCSL